MTDKQKRLEEIKAESRTSASKIRGERNGSAKLNKTMALQIHERIANGESDKEIAKDYPVGANHINNIRRGFYWRKEDL